MINEIKINEKIKVGDVFKNYKALCEALNIEPKLNGKSKNLQLKKIENCIGYTRNGHKYIITEIKKKQYDFSDERIKGIFVQHIETILLQEFIKRDTSSIILTKHDLYKLFGFYNNNYNNIEKEKLFLNDNKDIDIFLLKDFKNDANIKFNQILLSALKSLERRKIIYFSNEIIINSNNDNYIANDELKEEILEIEHEVLNYFGYNDINNIYFNNLEEKYYKEVNFRLYENLHINSCYKVIKIIVAKKYLTETLEQNIIELEKECCNLKICNSLIEHANKKYNKIKENTKNNLINLPNNFIELQYKMTNMFIKYIKTS